MLLLLLFDGGDVELLSSENSVPSTPADKGKETIRAKFWAPPSIRSFSADTWTVHAPAMMSLELTTIRSTLLVLSREHVPWLPEQTPDLFEVWWRGGGSGVCILRVILGIFCESKKGQRVQLT